MMKIFQNFCIKLLLCCIKPATLCAKAIISSKFPTLPNVTTIYIYKNQFNECLSFNFTLPADILQLHLVFQSHHTGMLHRLKKKRQSAFCLSKIFAGKKPHHSESGILSHSATRWILLWKVQNSRWILPQGENKKPRRKNEDFCVCGIY